MFYSASFDKRCPPNISGRPSVFVARRDVASLVVCGALLSGISVSVTSRRDLRRRYPTYMADPEERTEQVIEVRQVTDVHSNWNDEGSGEPGKFSFQLILDDGAEEYVIRPTPQDSKVIIKLLGSSKSHYFDLQRGAFIANEISLGS